MLRVHMTISYLIFFNPEGECLTWELSKGTAMTLSATWLCLAPNGKAASMDSCLLESLPCYQALREASRPHREARRTTPLRSVRGRGRRAVR